MSKKRSYNKYLRNINTSNAINIGNATGLMVTGQIGAHVPAAGASAMAGVYGAYGVSSQLGTMNAAFGKGGLMDAVSDLGKTGRKRRR